MAIICAWLLLIHSALIDAHDESLRKWKESLGLGTGTPIGDPNDKRTVVIESLGLEVPKTTPT
jgi:hypothetical protein